MIKIQPDIQDLYIFKEVCSDRNLTITAKRLDMTQPAISLVITKIEKQLSTRLFDRSYRPIRLTLTGRRLLSRAQEILDLYEKLHLDMNAFQCTQPDIRLGYSDGFSTIFGPSLVPKILKQFGRITTVMGLTPEIRELLLASDIDVAIGTDPMLNSPSIHHNSIFSEKYFIVFNKRLSFEIKGLADIHKLFQRRQLVTLNRHCYSNLEEERILRRLEISPIKEINVDSYATIASLINADIGWSVIPTLFFAHVEEETIGNFSFIPINSSYGTRTTYILWQNLFFETVSNKISFLIKNILSDELIPSFNRINLVLSNSIQLLP